jgi:putative glutamine amidotransferase
MKKIGITVDLETASDGQTRCAIKARFANAISNRGAIPILLPNNPEFIDEYIDMIDGLMISGGPVINCSSIDDIEKFKDSGDLSDRRVYFEYKLIQRALEKDLPVLGICFGEQLINLIYGGSIKSNIPNHIESVYEYTHKVNVVEGSKLHGILGETRINVNTSHSQGVDEVGEGLDIVATSEEGIVEAIEDKKRLFCIGVQWHPEVVELTEKSDEIFEAFLA